MWLALVAFAGCGGGGGGAGSDSGGGGGGGGGGGDAMPGDSGPGDSGPAVDAGVFHEPTCTPGSDAPTWTLVDPHLTDFSVPQSTLGAPYVSGAWGLAYGNGVFVTVAQGNNLDHLLWATTTDGTTWTPHTQALGAGVKYTAEGGVWYLGGRFITFGNQDGNAYVYTSTDGATWTAKEMKANARAGNLLAYSGSVYVNEGANNIYWTSPDLETWAQGSGVTPGSYGYDNIAFGQGHFVTGINGGGQVFTGSDGVTWTDIPNVQGPGGSYVTTAHGVFVLLGNKKFTSTDGVTFVPMTSDPLIGGPGFSVGNQMVWLGVLIQGSSVLSEFLATTDGNTYVPFGGAPAAQQNAGTHSDMAFGRCKYILVGNNTSNGTFTPFAMVADGAPAP